MRYNLETIKKALECCNFLTCETYDKLKEAVDGFDKELRRKQGYPHHYHKNEYWIRIKEILGDG